MLERKIYKSKKFAIENAGNGIIVHIADYYIVGDIYTFMEVIILNDEGQIIGSMKISDMIDTLEA